jgi:hypothetical protein
LTVCVLQPINQHTQHINNSFYSYIMFIIVYDKVDTHLQITILVLYFYHNITVSHLIESCSNRIN